MMKIKREVSLEKVVMFALMIALVLTGFSFLASAKSKGKGQRFSKNDRSRLNRISENTKYQFQFHGTEYTSGQLAKVWLFLLEDGQPIINSSCLINIYYPNSTLMVKNEVMSPTVEQNGIFYYDLTAPETKGVYMTYAKCILPQNTYVNNFVSSNKTESLTNLTVENQMLQFPETCNQTLIPDNSNMVDYNKIKPIDVASVSETPTISKAQPLKITSGDDSTTGTGKIVLDWTNIDGKEDIAVYDENGNLLDYYFEKFDIINKTAVIWVYKDWIRDGSTQAQIVYGNSSNDQSVTASTVFDKETNLQAGYLFNEVSGDLLDVTSNNNDGTVNGATQGVTGQVGDAYDFDGADDYVDCGSNVTDNLNSFTVMYSVKADSWTDNYNPPFRANFQIYHRLWKNKPDTTHQRGIYIGDGSNWTDYTTDTNEPTLDTWYLYTLRWDGNTFELLYNDANSQLSVGTSSASTGTNSEALWFGTDLDSPDSFLDALIDNARIYSSSLSSDDISALYTATKSTPDFFSQKAGKIGSWRNIYTGQFISEEIELEGNVWDEFNFDLASNGASVDYQILDSNYSVLCHNQTNIYSCSYKESPVHVRFLFERTNLSDDPKLDRYYLKWSTAIIKELRGSGELHISEPKTDIETIKTEVWKTFYKLGTPEITSLDSAQELSGMGLVSASEGTSTQTCLDNQTLQISQQVVFCEDSSCQTFVVNKTKQCSNGCSDGKCITPPTMKYIITSLIFVILMAIGYWIYTR